MKKIEKNKNLYIGLAIAAVVVIGAVAASIGGQGLQGNFSKVTPSAQPSNSYQLSPVQTIPTPKFQELPVSTDNVISVNQNGVNLFSYRITAGTKDIIFVPNNGEDEMNFIVNGYSWDGNSTTSVISETGMYVRNCKLNADNSSFPATSTTMVMGNHGRQMSVIFKNLDLTILKGTSKDFKFYCDVVGGKTGWYVSSFITAIHSMTYESTNMLLNPFGFTGITSELTGPEFKLS